MDTVGIKMLKACHHNGIENAPLGNEGQAFGGMGRQLRQPVFNHRFTVQNFGNGGGTILVTIRRLQIHLDFRNTQRLIQIPGGCVRLPDRRIFRRVLRMGRVGNGVLGNGR